MNDKKFRHFKNENSLVQELLKVLNDQYEHAPEEEKSAYYDWIYWVLDKSNYDIEE
jgi:hypothetical protein